MADEYTLKSFMEKVVEEILPYICIDKKDKKFILKLHKEVKKGKYDPEE